MEQTLLTQLIIHIPADQVLIDKTEYNELQNQKLQGTIWSMEDLRDHLQRKATWWVVQEVLIKYKAELDIENGGFVIYPRSKGKPWRIGGLEMAQFIEANWKNFDWDAERRVLK